MTVAVRALATFFTESTTASDGLHEVGTSSSTCADLILPPTASSAVLERAQHTYRSAQAAIQKCVYEITASVVIVDHSLLESGVDSLAATELQDLLQHEFGSAAKVPSTLVFEQPTGGASAGFRAAE